jgi:hypothetical protein
MDEPPEVRRFLLWHGDWDASEPSSEVNHHATNLAVA